MTTPAPRRLGNETLTASEILAAVSAEFGIPSDAIVAHRRDARHVRPRHIAMWLCRDALDMSFPAIGKVFGRDHSTVMHGCARIEDALASGDADMTRDVSAVRQRLRVPVRLSAPTMSAFEAHLTDLQAQRDAACQERDTLLRERNEMAHEVIELRKRLEAIRAATGGA